MKLFPAVRVSFRQALRGVVVPVAAAVAIVDVVENVVDWGIAIMIVGAGFVYGVHRATRSDPT